MSAARKARRATREENLVAGVLLVIFAGIVYLCQDFGPRARMIPLPLAIFGIVLTLIQLLWQNLRSTDELQMDLISVSAPLPVQDAEPEKPAAAARDASRGAHRELRAYAIVAALIALVLLAGLLPAVFIFTGGYVLITRHYGWLKGLTYTTLLTASVYLLFMAALQIQPYHGLLAPLIEGMR